MKHLHIKLESARPDYSETEPLIVRYEIKNESKTPMRILVWGTPIEGFQSDMFQITKDGVDIPYQGKLVSRAALSDSDYITLKENQSIAREMDLSEAYDIQDGGKYVLHHRKRTLQVDLDKEKADATTPQLHRERDPQKSGRVKGPMWSFSPLPSRRRESDISRSVKPRDMTQRIIVRGECMHGIGKHHCRLPRKIRGDPEM